MFDLSAGSHEGKKLAMNAMINMQLWPRRLVHLNKRSLELMQRRGGNGVAFGDSIYHCDVCSVGKSHQLAQPKKAKHPDITAPFQLVYGDLTGPFKPAARGGYEYMSKIADQLIKWQSTSSAPRTRLSRRYSYSSLPPSFRSAAVSSLGEPIRAAKTPAKTSKRIARRRVPLSSSGY